MTRRRTRPGAERAAARLRQLLAEPGDYRTRWERWARGIPADRIDELAIGRVLAAHVGDRAVAGANVLRRRGSAVGRALTGQALDPRLLGHFIDAFEMAAADADRLWRLYSEENERPWRTLALQEFHHIGPDGVPVRHQTRHVLVAVTDGVDRYPYRFDTDQLSVTMVRGGTVSDPYPTGDGLFAVDILFSKPLRKGQPIGFEYDIVFHYSKPPAPEFRRAVRGWLESLSVSVQFDPGRLPRSVWWTTWSDYREGSPPLARVRVPLDREYSVFTRLTDVDDAVAGFCWQW